LQPLKANAQLISEPKLAGELRSNWRDSFERILIQLLVSNTL